MAVLVDVTVGSGANFYRGKSRDISTGGLFIAVDPQGPPPGVALEVGAEVLVCLRLEGELHCVPCEVAWSLVGADGRVGGAGVRFLDASPALKHSIGAFMSRRSPMEVEAPLDA